MDKEVVLHIHNGVLLSYKKKNAFDVLYAYIKNALYAYNAYIWNLERQ